MTARYRYRPRTPEQIRHVVRRLGLGIMQARGSVPPDGIYFNAATASNGITLLRSAVLTPHPLFGRRIAFGLGKSRVPRWGAGGGTQKQINLLISDADVATLADFMEKPFNRPIPGHTGQWLAHGIYRDERGLWFTDSYLRERHRLYTTTWYRTHGWRKWQKVFYAWPRKAKGKSKVLGELTVSLDDDVQRILRRRDDKQKPDEKPQGEWLEKYRIWRDADGLHYSSSWLHDETGLRWAAIWHRCGLMVHIEPGRKSRRSLDKWGPAVRPPRKRCARPHG